MELLEKVALVTGTRRIGRVVALTLADAGACLVLTYHRSKEVAEQTVQDVKGKGRKAMAIQADVSRADQVKAMVDHALAAFGRIDVLIHMAALYQEKALATLTEEDWDQNLDVNLKSAFLCAQAVVPVMRRQGGGRIITFADWLARSGRPRYKGFVPYYVSKYGVIGFTEALALELAEDNILVNCIAPGPILKPPDLSEEENREVLAATPLKRWGGEEEIAKAVLALITSEFITGECIRVDGGRHVL
ncbi:MAG: SDR family oxidoreductase [candidate division NC10 bacterium]|nr:SDR family oxidoreductase [candidate division NC10 bacterium]